MYPRVLIVDDDSASLQMSKKAMEALIPAENISCASTAAETIALLGEKQIDLAFLDIDIDGYLLPCFHHAASLRCVLWCVRWSCTSQPCCMWCGL